MIATLMIYIVFQVSGKLKKSLYLVLAFVLF